jgi:hypothetical protein
VKNQLDWSTVNQASKMLKAVAHPVRLKMIEERVERNKKRLARQLDLAYRFGQFENEAHTTNYRFLGRMIADDLLMNEAKWYDVAKEIEEMRPEP